MGGRISKNNLTLKLLTGVYHGSKVNKAGLHFDMQGYPKTGYQNQTGDQCLYNRVIFLFRLAQLQIGYGWGSMAPIWNHTGHFVSLPFCEAHKTGGSREAR